MEKTSYWHSWLTSCVGLSPETAHQLVRRFERAGLSVDPKTLDHSQRAAALAWSLAQKAGLSDAQQPAFWRGALLHDVGKFMIPAVILEKAGPLTPEEWAVVKRHPYFSYLLLCDLPELEPALEIPTNHHECWDGSGYPRGLKGEEIPVAARIYTIVDIWDALVSDRPYRPAFPVEKAKDLLARMAGKQIDPHLFELFAEMMPI